MTDDLKLKVKHSGRDGGKIDTITLLGSKREMSTYYTCKIEKKLDNDETHEVNCHIHLKKLNSYDESCNGHSKFCLMKFNQVVFPGAHNAGTGMSTNELDCITTNHDLNLSEMLDFGLRFLDFDLKYDTTDGVLYTGHGPEDWYYVFGKFQEAMDLVHTWMKSHSSEILVLRFGEIIGPKNYSLNALKRILEQKFNGLNNGTNLNNVFRSSNGKRWPTLGEAKMANQRVFVFAEIEDEEDMTFLGDKIIGAVKIKGDDDPPKSAINGAVKILSTYSKTNVEYTCLPLANAINDACQNSQIVDFVKLDMHSALTKNLGSCLWTVARKCNSQLEDTIQFCKNANKTVRFLQADYPNYPGPNGKTNVETAFEENCNSYNIYLKD